MANRHKDNPHRKGARHKFEFARKMRNNPTPPEAILWQHIRRDQLGVRVRRQAVVKGYIVDFYITNLRVAIEVDGKMHDPVKDAKRDANLAKAGVGVIRIPARDVFQDAAGVAERLRKVFEM